MSPEAVDRFCINVSKYIKGFWCDIFEEGLQRRLSESKEQAYIKKVSADLFDEVLP